MPILDIQRQERQLGRIRLGKKSGGDKGHPQKLDKFRFTSPDKGLIDAISVLYGGETRPWVNDGATEYEVFSLVDRVPIVVPPQKRALSQWYEMWSGGGCQRRCDGVTNILKDEPCACPSDPLGRAVLAQSGRACKPTTRLNVMLRDVPGVGVWRIDSHGFYSAAQLPNITEFLAQATEAGIYVPAELVLVRQSVKRPGEGRREWFVPMIDVKVTPRQLMSGDIEGLGAGARSAIGGSRQAIEAPKRDEAHFRAAAKRAESIDELTTAFAEAQKAGFAPRGSELFEFFAQRGQEIKDGEVAVGEIVDEPDESELDDLWGLIVENAGHRDSHQLEREFSARNDGLHPQSANAKQLRAFLEHLRAAGSVVVA